MTFPPILMSKQLFSLCKKSDSKTFSRSKRYKTKSLFSFDPFCCLILYIKAILFVLDTPELLWEVIKRLVVSQLHGNFTPSRFSAGCPHLLRRSYHARLYDRTGVSLSPIVGYRHESNYLSFIANCFSLHNEIFLLYLGAIAIRLMLITMAMGMYLMNGYSLFKLQIEQDFSPFTI